jgi:hypothetical protein
LTACAGSWLLAGAGCDGGGCDLDTCSSTEEATLNLAGTVTELADATVRACRNADCRTGSLAELPNAEALGVAYPIALSPDDGAETDPEIQQLTMFARVEEQGVRLEFSWRLTSAAAVKVGDLLHVIVMAASGEVVFDDMAATPRFDEYGRDERCNKPACRSAVVALGD